MSELVVIAIILAAVLIIVSSLSHKTSSLDRKRFGQRWQEVSALIDSGNSGYKLAVIEADKLLDHALKARGFKGETMGDRMKSAGRNLGNQDSVWSAHRLRNRLVHEEATINKRQAQSALNAFKQSLKYLGAL